MNVAGGRAFHQPAPVELRGVPVGIAGGVRHRAGEMREVMGREGLQPVPPRVVDLIVGRRREAAGLGVGGRRVADALQREDAHAPRTLWVWTLPLRSGQ